MTTIVLSAYYVLLSVLALYGLHRLYLLTLLGRTQPAAAPPAPEELPRVTVQLPIFNELFVAPRLVEAAATLDYPRDLLEIQVLDDSTDETRDVLAAQVERLRARGVDIVHLTRTDRTGYKAGALAAGLACARGELVAVFDADFVPEPDFLMHTVGAFQDEGVGMVQTRWGHINRASSVLTRAQAVLLDGHFLVEHDARARSGRFFNFNGTAGIWRRSAIESAGDWQHDTLTEDLDLSYRAQLAGWRFVFLPDIVAPAELPLTMSAFKGQQQRWTQGSIQTLRKLGRRILTARLPVRTRLEAMVHLSSNFCYVGLVLLATLLFPAMWARSVDGLPYDRLALDLLLLGSSTGAVSLFYVASQLRAGQPLLRSVALLPAVLALGTGLAVHNALAVLRGWRTRGGVFERTPKFGDVGASSSTAGRARIRQLRRKTRLQGASYRSPITLSSVLELALCSYLLACVGLAIAEGMFWSLPFLGLLLAGFSWVSLRALQDRWDSRPRREPGVAPRDTRPARAA